MDPKVQEVIKRTSEALNPEKNMLERLFQTRTKQIFDQCYKKHSTDAILFGECVNEINSKINTFKTAIDLHWLFYTKDTNYCLKNNGSVKDCTSDFKKGMRDIFETTKRQIEV